MNSISGSNVNTKKGFVQVFSEIIVTLSRWLNNVGVFFLIIMMMATVVDVTLRYFKVGVMGAYEVVEFAMVLCIFFCIGFCQADKMNVAVEILYDRLGKKAKAILDAVNYAVSFVLVCIVVYANILGVGTIKAYNATSAVLQWPMYPFYIVLVIGYIMLALVLIADFVVQIDKIRTKSY